MKGLNKVQLIGNLGKDPEIKYMPSGAAVAKFSVATAEKWKDRQTGEMQERTEWHNIVAFNKIAEVIEKYLVKGSKVFIEGQLKTDKWQDNNGNDRWTTSIVVRDMLMLDGPQGAQNAPGATQQAPRQSAPQQQAPRQQQAAAPAQDDFEDDIPF